MLEPGWREGRGARSHNAGGAEGNYFKGYCSADEKQFFPPSLMRLISAALTGVKKTVD